MARKSGVAEVVDREAAGVRFHPVRLAGSGETIEIQLVGGRLRVAPGFQAEDLRRVLAVLESGTPC